MVSHIRYRGPDGIQSWFAPRMAMAFAKHARTPDAPADRQPLNDPVTETCITFDGRLDNREELAAELDVRLSDFIPDSLLAAAAYRRWGVECPVRLLGDFSLVIWDGRERRLFAARDILGVRPLFYRRLHGVWLWASDQRALMAFDMPTINEGYVGEILSSRITSIDETIYHSIHRLPMGHAFVLTDTMIRCWRYWRPKPDARLEYRDRRDYEQHFRMLLKEAVRARLRICGRATLMLSGGIDSSSVAVQIGELQREGHEGAARTTALSMTVPGSPACEEPVIRQVLRSVRLPCEMLAAQEPGEEHFSADAAAALDVPESPSSSMIQPLRDAAIASGCSIVLTGCGGDDWFEPSYGEFIDLLRRGRVIASGRWLGDMARITHQLPRPQIVRQGMWMALPLAAKRVVRGLLRRNPVPWWIDRRFAQKHHLADRVRRMPDDVAFRSLAQYDIFRAATGGEATFRGDHEERCMAAQGLEQRHPLMDRRLVEFALALPVELRCADGVSKVLMRRAMSDILPAGVTADPRNDDFGFIGLRVLRHLGGANRLSTIRPIQRAWISADAVSSMYGMLEGGLTRYLWPLCSAIMVDFWLQALERVHYEGHEGRQTRHVLQNRT